MPEQPSDPIAPLPGQAVRDAVLESARRKRSARPYVIPGVLVGGLVAPIVAMGTTDQPPVPVPGLASVTDTTTTTDTADPTDTTATTPATDPATTTDTTSTTPTDTSTTPDGAPTDRADDGTAPPTDTTTTPTTPDPAPTPAPEPSPTGIPTDPAAAPLIAKVKAAKKKKGRGNKLKLTDHQRRIIRDAERNSDITKMQSALGPSAPSAPSSTQSSQAFNDLLALPGSSQAVPEKAISNFQIPPFLLPIYQAAGAQYGIRWEVLAAINEIETNYGRNLNISSAGAEGWMQFMPSTWETWGVDANRDGRKDPFNPVDAIFAAGRYLKASGANTDLRKAIFSYNHADWYVDSVLQRARRIAAIPPSLTDALGQMAEGYFPIAGKGQVKSTKDGANIKTLKGSAVIAVQDGEVVKSGTSKRLGRYIQIRDAQGTVYTYGNLQRVGLERDGKGWARRLPETSSPAPDFGVEEPASVDTPTATVPESQKVAQWTAMPSNSGDLLTGATSLVPDPATEVPATTTTATTANSTNNSKDESEPGTAKPAKSGRKILAGTVLGRASNVPVRFEIRPAGAGRIDPAPILSGWKLLQNTALFRVKGQAAGNTGQVLLMSQEALEHRVLHDPRIKIYPGGRNDIETGTINRRVLATLAFLAESGLDPTVSCLRTGHSLLTSSGNVSEHVSGNAVDISAINGIPITGHQGKGTITETTIRKLLTLQGGMKPHQIISLMTFPGTDNTLSLPDHYNHIHVGFHPPGTVTTPSATTATPAVLKPDQWDALVARVGSIDNPKVSATPSPAALKVAKQQLKDAAKSRAVAAKDAKVDDYDSYQDGVKDPFIPPWLARDQT